ncbi:hypothetical protein [Limosilactobacillus ingluviei]|uniref:hypothetical protein n=1 Tax=Limosilactobacillus ingluviei TaxID=148604 RepID=UPI0023F23493|nr:hypothetical protein [Limosilactobacillus ingluviei]
MKGRGEIEEATNINRDGASHHPRQIVSNWQSKGPELSGSGGSDQTAAQPAAVEG